MRNKLLLLLLGVVTMFTGCSREETELSARGEATSFKLSVDHRVQSRAVVTDPTRYAMELYQGATATGDPLSRVVQDNGNFDVVLENGKQFTILFWADYGDATNPASCDYDITSLKAAKVAAGKTPAKPAFSKAVRFTVGEDDADVYTAVTLQHSVAQVNYVQNEVLTAPTNKLKVIYPKTYSINVDDNSVTEMAGAVTHEFNYSGTAAATLGTDYIIAATGDIKTILDIQTQFNGETVKDISGVPFACNFRTNITGAYSNLYNANMTVSCDDVWGTPDEGANLPQPGSGSSMKFTIDLTSYADKSYILPFKETGVTGNYTLTINWGDGTANTKIEAGTDLTTAISHTYAQQQAYQITITSSEADATKEQVPGLKPGFYKMQVASNPAKLKSMDSPMLNTKEDLSGSFITCRNLTSIPADLFKFNAEQVVFESSFSFCTSFTTIPEGLFDYNTQATNFNGCFAQSGITSIPIGLFDQNTKVTTFEGCFVGCASVTSIPAGLFDHQPLVESFKSCFTQTGITSIPAGLFDHNVAAVTFNSCFRGSNLTSIPELLFKNNINATDFKECFTSIGTLRLNSNIFCNEATEKATRFAGKVMNFEKCFKGSCGDISLAASGTAPELWGYAMEESSTYIECFDSRAKFTNQSSIPSSWK